MDERKICVRNDGGSDGAPCGEGTHFEEDECVPDATDGDTDTDADTDTDTDTDGDTDADADADADTDTDTDTGEPAGTDEDGDGVTLEDGDCDDTDDTIYPGADEVWDDGIDQDCDGEDADTHVERCSEAVPCPAAINTYTSDEEWATIANCSIINGSVEFVDRVFPDSIPDNCLQIVWGNVTIEDDEAIANLSALSLLSTVGLRLRIVDNWYLESAYLPRLTYIGDYVNISDNTVLESFSLDSLLGINGRLVVNNNAALTSFSLNSLTAVGGDLTVDYNVLLCQSLVDAFVSALEALGWEWSAYISHNADC